MKTVKPVLNVYIRGVPAILDYKILKMETDMCFKYTIDIPLMSSKWLYIQDTCVILQ